MDGRSAVLNSAPRCGFGQLEPQPEKLPPALQTERGAQIFLLSIIAVGVAALAIDELLKHWRRRH